MESKQQSNMLTNDGITPVVMGLAAQLRAHFKALCLASGRPMASLSFFESHRRNEIRWCTQYELIKETDGTVYASLHYSPEHGVIWCEFPVNARGDDIQFCAEPASEMHGEIVKFDHRDSKIQYTDGLFAFMMEKGLVTDHTRLSLGPYYEELSESADVTHVADF